MAKKRIVQLVWDMARPIVELLNFELVDVEYLKEGENWYLRVYIDKPQGITIDDCQKVSEELSAILDEEDPIDKAYFLEVSSPGIDRQFKTQRDFDKNIGEQVEIKLYKPINGTKIYTGELLSFNNNIVSIKDLDDKVLEFNKQETAYVKRVVVF